jgi:hypothetical protein
MGRLIRTSEQTYRLDDHPSDDHERKSHRRSILTAAAAIATMSLGVAITAPRKPAPPIVEAPTAPAPIATVAKLGASETGRRSEVEHLAKQSDRLNAAETAKTQMAERSQAVASTTPASPPLRKKQEPKKAKLAEPAVQQIDPHKTEPNPVGAIGEIRNAPSPWEQSYSSGDLIEQLKRVPLLEFTPLEAAGAEAKDARRERQAQRRDLERAAREHRENFLERVVKTRPAMSGLPFRKDKDCQLESAAAHDLDAASKTVRTQMARIIGRGDSSTRTSAGGDIAASTTAFDVYHLLVSNPRLAEPRSLPAVEQVLTGEAAPIRMGFINFLRSPADSPVVAALLARRAVFDTSAEVRQAARDGLRLLTARDYLPVLVSGLRHPWPPANYHAAEALAELNAQAAIPELIRILDEPDPGAPVEMQVDGKRVFAVRELVRLNHHASCLVCHAPSFSANEAVRAPVPDPDQPLPTRAYSSSSGDIFVRADITYLRQDFSEVLPVENPGRWPKVQRFDFVVRTRKLTEGDSTTWPPPNGPTDIQQIGAPRRATILALQQLTGLDGGGTAASWTDALAAKMWRRPTGR